MKHTLWAVALAIGAAAPGSAQEHQRLVQLWAVAGPVIDSLNAELAAQEATLGKEHPDLLPIIRAIRDVYMKHGALVTATPYMERALEITVQTHGPDHGLSLTAMDNLANMYQTQRDFARAQEIANRLRASVASQVEEGHPAIARSRAQVATVLRGLGEYERAAEEMEQALPVLMGAWGPAAHELTPMSLVLAEVLLRTGKVSRPEDLLTYALAIRSEAFDFTGPDQEAQQYVAPFESMLGALYTAAGFYDRAQEHLTKAEAAYEGMDEDTPALEPLFVHLASFHEARGDLVRAERYRSRAEQVWRNNLGYAFVAGAPRYPPIPPIPAATDSAGVFADAAVGDWIEYSANDEPSERMEVVEATGALVVIQSYRWDGNSWSPTTQNMVRRDIRFEEYRGGEINSLLPARCPFVTGDIDCLAWTYAGSYSSDPVTVFFAPDVIPFGGLLRTEMEQVVISLAGYGQGGAIVRIPPLGEFPRMVQAVGTIQSERELLDAARRGDQAAIERALDAGMDVNAFDGAVLGWAVEEQHAELAAFLIGRGATVSQRNLNTAARDGHIGLIELMLEHGAELNGTYSSKTALYDAVLNDQTNAVDLLLLRGADPFATGTDSATVLMAAASAGDEELVRRFLDLGLEVGARTREPIWEEDSTGARQLSYRDRREDHAFSAILGAASSNNPAIVRLLLEAGADAGDLDRGGNTTLYRAATSGNVEIGRLLLAGGADPNGGREGARTALMEAAEQGQVDFVRLLLDAGADVHASIAASGYQAIDGAEQNGHQEVVQVLRAAGARR